MSTSESTRNKAIQASPAIMRQAMQEAGYQQRITDLERQLSEACQQRDRAISNHMGAVEELAEARKAIQEAGEIVHTGAKLDAMRVAEIEGMKAKP